MGIGNEDTITDPDGRPSSSLPLMGIGNLISRRMLLKILDLITPHGDRKLEFQTEWMERGKLSLPLMGIGN